MPSTARDIFFPLAICLVAINLRPGLASVSPILDQIQHDTTLSDVNASLLTSLPVLLMGLCLLCAARVKVLLGDKLGIALGLGAIAFACLARWRWPTAPSLLMTALACGLGIAVVQALMPTIIRQRARDRTASMMGVYSTAIMSGAALGSYTAPRLAAALGWPVAAGIWVLPATIGMIVWWFSNTTPEERPPFVAVRSNLGKDKSWRLLTFFALGTGGYTLILAWLPPFYTGYGWSANKAGSLLAAVTLVEVIAGTAVTLGVHRFNDRRPMIFLAIGTLVVGLLCLCLAPLPLAWPAALFIGLGIGALFPLSLIVAMDHGDGPEEAGSIAAFVQGGGYLFAALLPLVAGIIRQHLSSLGPAWWLMIALCLVLALIAGSLRPIDRSSQSL